MEADPEPLYLILQSLPASILQFSWPLTLLYLIAGFAGIFILLGISASFSGAENAFFSLGPAEFTELDQMADRRSEQVLKLINQPDRITAGKRLLATILLGNNFVNIALVIASSLLIQFIFNFNDYEWLGFVIEVVFITFLLVLIGEIIPKIYATQNNVRIALLMAAPLVLLQKILAPFVTALVKTSFFFDRYTDNTQQHMSVADLNQAIELTTETHHSDEKNILIGLVNFGNISVREIMRVRMDVVGIDVESDSSDVFKLIQQHGYSRMPVYRENFDHVEGILFIKDLIPHIHEETAFAWRELIRPPMYVPEYKKIDQLLKEFQARHMHMAIVVDEYGASLGLVTMEDILEEIFGEIKDEYDDDDIQYSRLDDQTYLFEAKISLNDLCKVLELDHDFFDDFKGDSESLGGVIQEMEQRIPPRGTRVQIQHLKMTIESSDRRKINRVKIQLLSEASSERAHED